MKEASSSTKPFKEKSKLFFFILVTVAFFAFLMGMPRLSIPLMVSYVLYLIVSPAVPLLGKLGLSNNLAAFIVFITFFASTVIPIVKLVPVVVEEAENFQYYIPKIEKYANEKYEMLRFEVEERTGFKIGDQYITEGLTWIRGTSGRILLVVPKILASVIEWVFILPLFFFFMLKDNRKLKKIILGMTPNSIFERFYSLSYQFNKKLGDYIFAKFVEATIVGGIITIGLWALDVKFALLLGLIAGITNIIPYVGPVLGFIPALVYALAEYGSGTTFGGILILYLVANAIDIALVFPILVSKVVDLHPVIVVTSVILGSQWLGVIGMVISIPVAAAVKLIVLQVFQEVYGVRRL